LCRLPLAVADAVEVEVTARLAKLATNTPELMARLEDTPKLAEAGQRD